MPPRLQPGEATAEPVPMALGQAPGEGGEAGERADEGEITPGLA